MNIFNSVVAEPEKWTEEALCREVDPDLWYPENHADQGRNAKMVCRRCPVRAACLEYALRHNEQYGIWGGLSRKQRDAVARQRRGQVAA